jgi:hypothetical protein
MSTSYSVHSGIGNNSASFRLMSDAGRNAELKDKEVSDEDRREPSKRRKERERRDVDKYAALLDGMRQVLDAYQAPPH